LPASSAAASDETPLILGLSSPPHATAAAPNIKSKKRATQRILIASLLLERLVPAFAEFDAFLTAVSARKVP
jgi:hypothetical protein